MTTGRSSHTATLLPNGQVLVAAGESVFSTETELFDVGLGFMAAWQPTVSTITSSLVSGQALAATGSGFRGYGLSEASGSGFNNSASNYPLVQLRRLDNEQTAWLTTRVFSETTLTTLPTTGIVSGYALATVIVNGVPSEAHIILVVNPVVNSTRIYLPLITKNQ
jgi:hypothetical protein